MAKRKGDSGQHWRMPPSSENLEKQGTADDQRAAVCFIQGGNQGHDRRRDADATKDIEEEGMRHTRECCFETNGQSSPKRVPQGGGHQGFVHVNNISKVRRVKHVGGTALARIRSSVLVMLRGVSSRRHCESRHAHEAESPILQDNRIARIKLRVILQHRGDTTSRGTSKVNAFERVRVCYI